VSRFLDLHCEDAADVVVTGSRHLSAIAAAAFDCSRLVWMADWRRRGSRCWMLVKTPSLHTARCCFVSRQILFLSVENNYARKEGERDDMCGSSNCWYCRCLLLSLKTARVGWQFVEVPTKKGNHRKSPSNVEAS